MPHNKTTDSTSRAAAARPSQRGTVLVFVLGILTLVALVGVGLLASVRGERGRITQMRSTIARPQVMDRVVELIQERLWMDLWMDSSTNQIRYLNAGAGVIPGDTVELNEPFDAPGPNDRWLASTIPYLVRDAGFNILDVIVNPGLFNNKEQTIAWPRVTYIGSDLNVVQTPASGSPIFAWPWRSRMPAIIGPTTQVYGDYPNAAHSLDSYPHDPLLSNGAGIPVVLTLPVYSSPPFPAGFPLPSGNPLIPGSTTNVTIADARVIWNTSAWVPALWRTGNGTPAQPQHRFPYFDTNMDGVLDLYDADGDGVPDSPISLVLPYPVQRPGDPKEVYVVVRIIDNSSMVNVNTASSLTRPGTPGSALFDESSVDLQQRGRRVEEVALNAVVKPHDSGIAPGSTDRVNFLMANRSPVGTLQWLNYYMNHNDADFVRRELIGGTPRNVLPTASAFRPYGTRDESALRNRGTLTTQQRGNYDKTLAATSAVYSSIEEALRWTTMWSQRWNGVGVNARYDASTSRWQRFENDANSNLGEGGIPSNDLAAVSPTVFKGWKTLLDEDSPWFIGKNLLTTISYASTRMIIPRNFTLPTISTQPLWSPSPPLRLDPGTGAPAILLTIPTLADLQNGNFTEKVDLNPIFYDAAGNPTEPELAPQAKAEYIARLATALYIADLRLGWKNTPPRTSTSTSQEREDIAWQLAINIIDYADKDDEPTILVGPAGSPRYVGLEVQPFLQKVYCEVEYDYNIPDVTGSKTAVELVNPFTFNPLPGVNPTGRIMAGMDMTKYALKVTDSSGAGPLSVPLSSATTVRIPWMTRGAAINNDILGRLVVHNPGISVGANTNLVVVNSSTLTPVPGATFDLVNNDSLPTTQTGNFYYKKMELHRRLTLASGTTFDWVIDSMDLTRSNSNLPVGNNAGDDGFDVPLQPPGGPPFPNPSEVSTCFIRTTNRLRTVGGGNAACSWRFTVDDCTKLTPPNSPPNNLSANPGYPATANRFWGPTAGLITQFFALAGPSSRDYPCLGQATEAAVGTDYEGFPWYFRNTGYLGNNAIPPAPSPSWQFAAPFDSVADLSRVIAIGTLGTTSKKSIPTILKDNNIKHTATEDDPAMGRIDFGNSASVQPSGVLGSNVAQNAGRLFDLLTVSSLSRDGIDNDGDASTDEAGEALKLSYRTAGHININTAPASVLRSIPYMFWDHLLPANDWDMAAAIVAFREKRPVRAAYTPTAPYQFAAGSMVPNYNRFASIGDLAQLGPDANNPFAMRRFAKDSVDLLAHDTNTNFFSPNFDADRISDAADTQADELRERDILLTRFSNILTTRSDTYTVYIALVDENGRYVGRSQFTLDRSPCTAQDQGAVTGRKLLPSVIGRVDTDYYNDLQ